MRLQRALVILWLAACGGDDKTVTEEVCLGTSMMCGDACANVMSDNDNCGACGNACDATSVCANGTCAPVACPAGQMTCGDSCKDTQADADNCGACGNACSVGSTCEAGACEIAMWETLEPMTTQIMWQDNVSAGATVAYGLAGAALIEYTLPTTAEPLGVYATLMAPPTSFAGYTTLTQVGASLYVIEDTSVYVYDIAGNTWTTPVMDLTHFPGDAQIDHDDNGHVYTWAEDQFLVDFDTATSTPAYIDGPDDLPTSEPRAAWDSASDKLYLGDYEDSTGTFYSYDPATMTFAPLARFPLDDGLGDAVCADRAGHIYATSSGDSDTSDVWVYTVASNEWSRLPNLPIIHGSSPSCFYADGYLYVSNGDTNDLVRLAL